MVTHSSILAWRIPMDRGAWQATIHVVSKSWSQRSDWEQHTAHSDYIIFPGISQKWFCVLLNTLYYSVVQSCLILCDLIDCSPPGSSVHGILQARILEWVTISYSRECTILGRQLFFTWLKSCLLYFFIVKLINVLYLVFYRNDLSFMKISPTSLESISNSFL